MPNEIMSIRYIFGNNLKNWCTCDNFCTKKWSDPNYEYIFSEDKLQQKFSQIQKTLSAIQEES